jgi:ATP-dependent DNA helicase DinG
MTLDLEAILSSHLKGYEPRAEQGEMAGAVWDALRSGGRLIVEAGTGTGKSLAYLMPLAGLVTEGDTRAVVSTYTKALQRQLIEKDLPFLKKSAFNELRYALCMGSENYLCLRRLDQAKTYGLFTEKAEEINGLLEWASATRTGIWDAASVELWRKVAREGDMCHSKECKHHGRCFYQRAKERERQSHILVVNHHLYFANLASGGRVLPRFDAAVFDEAHELEDVAAGYLGVEVSNYRVAHVANAVLGPRGKGLLSRLKWLSQSDFSHAASLVNAVRTNSDKFFKGVSRLLDRQSVRLREKNFIEDTLSEHLLRLMRELEGLRGRARDDEDRRELAAIAQRCEAAAEALGAILGQELEEHVYWAEKAGRRTVRLAAAPVDVAGMDVFSDLEAAVFTSATLSTGGDFNYIKERLGLEGAQELLLRSHFNYREQAAIYIPDDLPEPNTPGYEERALERIAEILRITGGRTLVLFTSHGMLARAAGAISIEGLNILRQGEADSYRLIEEFRADPRSALFGAYTFWQGIDVPGEALECVIITRLPFAAPDEPVVEARMEMLDGRGMDPFTHYQLPRAAIMLKQGFGRLIRTSADRGVVAILDRRIRTKPYGRVFLRSLPECGITTELQDMGLRFGGAVRTEES